MICCCQSALEIVCQISLHFMSHGWAWNTENSLLKGEFPCSLLDRQSDSTWRLCRSRPGAKQCWQECHDCQPADSLGQTGQPTVFHQRNWPLPLIRGDARVSCLIAVLGQEGERIDSLDHPDPTLYIHPARKACKGTYCKVLSLN